MNPKKLATLAAWFLTSFLMLMAAPWASVGLAAEPGMEIQVGSTEMDNALLITSKLTNVDPDKIGKGIWTYKIDGVGTRTESEGCASDCLTYFNLDLFKAGESYQLTVTFKNADPSGSPQQVTGTRTFIAPSPYEEPEGFGIRCSVDFDRAGEHFYVYARLESDVSANGTWTYREKGTGRIFKLTGDRDTSFLKIGNAPGKVEAEISFDGTVDGSSVHVSSLCKYVKEGIKARTDVGSAGMGVTGTLLYGSRAAGTWTFTLKDSGGNTVRQASVTTADAPSAFTGFEQIPPGKYVLTITFDGKVNGKNRILTGSENVTVESQSGLPPGNGGGSGDGGSVTSPNGGPSGGSSGGDSSGGDAKSAKPSVWFLAPFGMAIVVGVVLWIWVYRKM